MPRIQTYETQTRAPGAVEYRGGNRGSIGPGLSQLGNAVGTVADVVYKRTEQSETSDASASIAELNAKTELALQEKSRDPNAADDKDLVTNFLKDYDEQLAAIEAKTTVAGSSTFVKDRGSASRAKLFESASSAQAELAGYKAVENHEKSLNARITTLMSSPSSYDFESATHDEDIVRLGESHQIPVKQLTEMRIKDRSALAEATMRGWIKSDPSDNLSFAKKVLEDPKWNESMSGDLRKQIQGEIVQEEHARRTAREQARVEKERLFDEKQKVIQNNAFTEFFKGTPASQIIRDIGTKPGLDPEKRVATMNAIAKLNDDKSKPDPGVFNAVAAQVASGEINDERQLYPYLGHGLDKSDYSFFSDRLKGTEAEKRAMSDLDKVAVAHFGGGTELSGFKDPAAESLLKKWHMFAWEETKEGLAKGKSRLQIAGDLQKHLEDPAFNRSAEEIRQDVMRERGVGFRPTLTGKPFSYVDDKLEGLNPVGAAPSAPRPSPSPSAAPSLLDTAETDKARKPGETLVQWRARVKGK